MFAIVCKMRYLNRVDMNWLDGCETRGFYLIIKKESKIVLEKENHSSEPLMEVNLG